MKDHECTEWKTKGEMCAHWRISPTRFNRNIANGMSLEAALTTPPMSPSQAGKLGRDASGWGRGNEILIGKSRR